MYIGVHGGVVITNNAKSNGAALLGLLDSFVPSARHVIAVRSTTRLELRRPRLMHLRSHPPGVRNGNTVAVHSLMHGTLHVHPSHVVINRYHNNRTLSVLRTVGAKRSNSLAAIRTGAPHSIVSHLRAVILVSNVRLPSQTVHRRVSSTISLVIRRSHFDSNSHEVARVSRMVKLRKARAMVRSVFIFGRANIDRSKGVRNRLTPANSMPSFFRRVGLHKLRLSPTVFEP